MTDGRQIAIVGYACRLPGANSSDALWRLLQGNHCSVGKIDQDRFPTDALFHPAREARGRSYTFAAGTIEDPWGFDAAAFGISPREAEQMDPQQRHLLEVTFDALHHAGIAPGHLAGGRTGVYVGASSSDHVTRFLHDPPASDVHMMTGNTLSLISNRLSYVLDLRGPCLTIDTACSSSLVALCQAADAIRSGVIDTALVGGVNLLLSPFPFVGFSRASMLSASGRCRPFDADADGYVRSEGVVAVVLQSVEAARRSRSHIHAELVGWATGQDGRTTGVSLPSMSAQNDLLKRLYTEARLDPLDLAFVEAHGTGTPVGDPTEAEAIGRALGWARRRTLPIGSIKSNIGHLEPAAGLAGLLKSLMALKHAMLPASLSFERANPNIAFDDLNLTVAQHNMALRVRSGTTLAGISSYGFGGTIAHVVLRHAAARKESGVLTAGHLPPLLLSAHTRPALDAQVRHHAEAWPADEDEAHSWIDSHAFRRDRLSHRLAVVGGSPQGIRAALQRHAAGADACIVGEALGEKVPAVFVFNGNGAQWAGMARDAWSSNATFRAALEEADERFRRLADISPLAAFHSPSIAQELRRATTAQPLLFAIQYGIVQALAAQGLTAAATVGHSIGEVAAAWAAGALTLDDAVCVVRARSLHQEPTRGSGGMVALLQGADEVRASIDAAGLVGLEVGAINSARSVTASGPDPQLRELLALAEKRRWSAMRLDLDYPFHSPLVEQVRAPLLADLARLRPQKPTIPLYSTVTGQVMEGDSTTEALGAEHWWRNVRQPVLFKAAIDRLIRDGYRLFVEIGPKPILGGYLRDLLRGHSVRGLMIETLVERKDTTQDGAPAGDSLTLAVARALVAGADIDMERLYGPVRAAYSVLPSYPWQHKRFKVERTAEATPGFAAADHPLLGLRARNGLDAWFNTIDIRLQKWLGDHRVNDTVLFPAAAFAEAMLAAAHLALNGAAQDTVAAEIRDLDIFLPLALAEADSVETQVRVSIDRSFVEFLSRQRLAGDGWTLHARGSIVRASTDPGATTGPDVTGTDVMDGAALYAKAEASGFGYGPHFRRVRRVAMDGVERAVLDLDAPASGGLDGDFLVDPLALDGALHGLVALTSDEEIARGGNLLPVHIDALRVVRRGVQITQARLELSRRGDRSAVADTWLFDPAGHLAVEARGVRFTRAPGPQRHELSLLEEHLVTLDRPGSPTGLQPPPAALAHGLEKPGAFTLIEEACLRIAWERQLAAPQESETLDSGDSATAQRNAQLWALMRGGLARQTGAVWSVAPQCSLAPVEEAVRRLLREHPAYGLEAASLALLASASPTESVNTKDQADGLGRLGRRLQTGAVALQSLRRAAQEQVEMPMAGVAADTILRLLVIGAEHSDLALDLARRFPCLDVTVTDADAALVQDAEAIWASQAVPRVVWRPPGTLGDLASGSFDMAVAIDALHRLAISRESLALVHDLLRPAAYLLVAELAPSLFWDLLRGGERSWWARTANPEFPIPALLDVDDWIAELADAGFLSTTSSRPGDSTILLTALKNATATGPRDTLPALRLAGDGGPLVDALKSHGIGTGESGEQTIWHVGAATSDQRADEGLPETLAKIAAFLKAEASAGGTLWIVGQAHVGGADRSLPDPRWRAVTAAMRVAQNEFPDLRIVCVGIENTLRAEDAVGLLIEELCVPGAEREIVLLGNARKVTRVATVEKQADTPPEEQLDQRLERRISGAPHWAVSSRRLPSPNEIEIKVEATGLNFRDVMWSLGLLPDEALEGGYAGAALGMECAGIVSAVGKGVSHFQTGDRVAALAPAAFTTHAIAPQSAVVRLPPGMKPEEAAALPVAYLTAWYSLVHKGELQEGERVLIHGAAGGVGLAALQIAKRRGARVFATAGAPEKRALLRALGADHVLDSRSLAFADEIHRLTKGYGVDVVLNSLAGEAMMRSADCLAPFGRFLELGKRDFYANTRLGLRSLRNNISYHAIDLDRLLGRHQMLVRQMLGEILDLISVGELALLPCRVIAGEKFEEAFRLMQRSHHVGKIVIRPPASPPARVVAPARFTARPDGLHVIVGGLGGFGMATVRWLARRGARYFLLIGRSAQQTEAQQIFLDELRAEGVSIDVEAVDVTDLSALQRCLQDADRRRRIRGVTHAAMVLDDRPIARLDPAAIGPVFTVKATGAENLDRITWSMALDYFLLYSSATTTIGNPGQFNYVAANGFLEGLALRRRTAGKPATAIAWGAIGDAGYLARNASESRALRRRLGDNLLRAEEALDRLDCLLRKGGTAAAVIARIDWDQAHRELQVVRNSTHSWIHARRTAGPTGNSDLVQQIRELPAEQREGVLSDMVRGEIARALRLPIDEVMPATSLADVGMDSLMMLELRSAIEQKLDIELPIMALNGGLTPADIVTKLASLLAGQRDPSTDLAAEPSPDLPRVLGGLAGSHIEIGGIKAETYTAGAAAVLQHAKSVDRLL